MSESSKKFSMGVAGALGGRWPRVENCQYLSKNFSALNESVFNSK